MNSKLTSLVLAVSIGFSVAVSANTEKDRSLDCQSISEEGKLLPKFSILLQGDLKEGEVLASFKGRDITGEAYAGYNKEDGDREVFLVVHTNGYCSMALEQDPSDSTGQRLIGTDLCEFEFVHSLTCSWKN